MKDAIYEFVPTTDVNELRIEMIFTLNTKNNKRRFHQSASLNSNIRYIIVFKKSPNQNMV